MQSYVYVPVAYVWQPWYKTRYWIEQSINLINN